MKTKTIFTKQYLSLVYLLVFRYEFEYNARMTITLVLIHRY